MGSIDIALRFALVVASVVADDGGFRGDEHRKNNLEIGLGKVGLLASSSGHQVWEAEFADTGKFSDPKHGSLHGSIGEFGHDRLTNNDFFGSLGDRYGLAASRHGDIAKNVGHKFASEDAVNGFKNEVGRAIAQAHSNFGGKIFGSLVGQNDDGIGIGLGNRYSGDGKYVSSLQETGYSDSHGYFGGSFPASQSSKLFGTESDRGTFSEKFGGFSSDHLGGHQNIHESKTFKGQKLLGFDVGVVDGHFRPIAGKSHQDFTIVPPEKKYNHYGAEVNGGFGGYDNFHPNLGDKLLSSIDIGHDTDIHGHGHSLGFNSEFDFGPKDEFGGHAAVIKGSVDHGLIDFKSSNKHFGGDIHGHGPSYSLDFDSGSDFGSKYEFGAHGATIKGGVHPGLIHHHKRQTTNSGDFSHQSSLPRSSSLGGFDGKFLDDNLKSGVHESVSAGRSKTTRTGGRAIRDIPDKFPGSVHHVGYRGDFIRDVSGGSLLDFVGSDAFSNVHRSKKNTFHTEALDGRGIRGISGGHRHGASVDKINFGSFGSSIKHERGNDDMGSIRSLGNTIVHDGVRGGSLRGFGGRIVHPGKAVRDSFESNPFHDGKEVKNSFISIASSTAHGAQEAGISFNKNSIQNEINDENSFVRSIVHEGQPFESSFGNNPFHGIKEHGTSLRSFDSSASHAKHGSGGSFDSNPTHEDKKVRSNFAVFGESPVHGKKRAADNFGSNPIHEDIKAGSSFAVFAGTPTHDRKKFGSNFAIIGDGPTHDRKRAVGSFAVFGRSSVRDRKEDEANFAVFGSSQVHGEHGERNVGKSVNKIVHGGTAEAGSLHETGSSPVHAGSERNHFGRFEGNKVPKEKENEEHLGFFGRFGSNIDENSDFDFGGFGYHAGGGNFFGFTEDDFLPGIDDDFTIGLADGIGGDASHGHGPSVVNYNGHEVHVAKSDSSLGSFGSVLSEKDVAHSGVTGFRDVLTHGGTSSSLVKAGHSGGSQDIDGTDHLSSFSSVIGGGGSFDDPNVSVHGRKHQAFDKENSQSIGVGVERDFGEDRLHVGKFGGAFEVHSGGHGTKVTGHQGKRELVTHEPSNPFGINGNV